MSHKIHRQRCHPVTFPKCGKSTEGHSAGHSSGKVLLYTLTFSSTCKLGVSMSWLDLYWLDIVQLWAVVLVSPICTISIFISVHSIRREILRPLLWSFHVVCIILLWLLCSIIYFINLFNPSLVVISSSNSLIKCRNNLKSIKINEVWLSTMQT